MLPRLCYGLIHTVLPRIEGRLQLYALDFARREVRRMHDEVDLTRLAVVR